VNFRSYAHFWCADKKSGCGVYPLSQSNNRKTLRRYCSDGWQLCSGLGGRFHWYTHLRRAEREWDWLERAPHVRMLPQAKRRIRWLTREEAHRLLTELPDHLAAMVRFTLATGLREANVVKLDWSQVDLERRCAWIHADQAKARKAIPVPLNAEAVLVLRQQEGKHPERVFTYKGKPVTKANNHAWRKALVRAGIEDFRWHDLRHTWASWHVQQGTPLHVLQELGG